MRSTVSPTTSGSAAPKQFVSLAEHAPFVVFQTDLDGRVIYCNAAWTSVTGFTQEESVGTRWLAAVHPQDQERLSQEWAAVVAGGGSQYCAAFRIRRKDGSVRHLQTSTNLHMENGKPTGYLGSAIDVTEQMQCEEQLHEKNALLEMVLEHIPCGVAVYDRNGRLRLHNRMTLELTGMSQADFHEHAAIGDIIRAYSQRHKLGWTEPEILRRVERSMGEPSVGEEVLPDGRVLEMRRAPLPQGGIVSVLTDVTRHRATVESMRKAKAEAEQAAHAKAAFLAVMSHEIRTPISGVTGMTALLMQTPLTPDQREMLEVIRQSSESLRVVINDILDFSKYDSGTVELEWNVLDLENLVRSSVQLVQCNTANKPIQIVHTIAQDVPTLVLGDEVRLRQVLLNLLSNALKFTERGSITISVAVAGQESEQQSGSATGDMLTLEIQVSDTGVGIPQSSLPRLFEPFFQAEAGTSRQFGGTGLGLAICKRVVGAMGGSIALESEAGVGTQVRFTFLAEAAVPATSVTRNANLKGKTVALVGAPPATAAFLHSHLKRWGVQLEADEDAVADALAASGPAAAKLDAVVVTDTLQDGSLTGFLDSVREIRPELPVLVLSPAARSSLLQADGVAAVLPLRPAESDLHQALAAAVAGSDTGGGAAAAALPASASGLVAAAPLGAFSFDETLAQRLPLRVLVAEDNKINAKVALRMLEAFGYDASLVENGLQAVEATRQHAFDLIFMDVHMPVMDGLQATRRIVQKRSPKRLPRIVAMTASVMREEIAAALAAGADACLAKPFSASELHAALENAARSATRKSQPASTDRGPSRSPGLPGGPDSGVLATNRLRSYLRLQDGREFLKGSITSFFTEARSASAKLQQACARRDAHALSDAAHELSNLCGVLGVVKVVGDAVKLEKMARRGELQDAAALVQQCLEHLEEGIDALAAFASRDLMPPTLPMQARRSEVPASIEVAPR